MNARKPSSRLTLWVFVAALLLRAAMPFLATASADLQGRTLVEVCTVYGVSMVPLQGEHHEPAPDHAATHGDTHCALTALAALGGGAAPVSWPASQAASTAPVDVPAVSAAPQDVEAAWIAGRKQGPPVLS